MTDEIVTWLRAQLDEDERVAQAAAVAPFARDWKATYPRWAQMGVWLAGKWWACRAKANDYEGAVQVVRAQVDPDDQDPDPTYCSGQSPYVIATDDADDEPVIMHIARHDPARVLREVEVKRRILDEHPHGANYYKPDEIGCGTCHNDAHGEPYHGVGNWCPTVRLLALPYADRPGYREEWRPE